MKNILLCFFLLSSIISVAQRDYYPDHFPQTKGVTKVEVKETSNSYKPKRKKELIQVSYFDEDGFNYAEYFIDRGKKDGKQKLTWNSDGTLYRYEGFHTYKGGSIHKHPKWDSTALSSVINYQYERDKLEKVIYRDGDDLVVTYEISFVYDSAGILKREDEFSYRTKEMSNIVYKRTKDTMYLEFYHNDLLKSTRKEVHDSIGNSIYELSIKPSGEWIGERKRTYDSKGRLIQKQVAGFQCNEFGSCPDLGEANGTFTYEYDKKNRLVKETNSFPGMIIYTKYYKYFEK